MQQPPCPIHTLNTTPHGALAIPSLVSSSTLAERPLAVSTDQTHRPPPPRLNTTAGNCFPSRTARSLWRLIHRVPASQCTHRVYVSASRMHQHRRMWVAARRTRCRCRGVRAEREGGVRELAVQRVAGRHAQRGHRHTARSQGRVRAPPVPHRAFSLAHVASAGVPLVLMPLFVQLDTLHE
jgi:hypothetical protein